MKPAPGSVPPMQVPPCRHGLAEHTWRSHRGPVNPPGQSQNQEVPDGSLINIQDNHPSALSYLIADPVIVTGEGGAHGGVALDDVLASYGLPEQVELGLGQQEAEDAASEAVCGDGEVGVVEHEHVVRSAAQVHVLRQLRHPGGLLRAGVNMLLLMN